MNILHITKITGIAGSENHLLTLMGGLRQRGHEVRCLMLVEPGNPVEAFASACHERDIAVARVTIRRNIDPAAFWGILQSIRQQKPDIVHTHLQHADLHGITAAILARVPGIISSRHNDNAFRRRAPYRQINRWLWRRVDAGIAISNAIRDFSITVEGAAPDKISTILYGLDPAARLPDRAATRAALHNELGLPDDALILGMVCRLIEQKGIPYALQAFAKIAADHPAAHIVIAGDGPLRGELETQANDLGIGEHAHFLGWRDEPAAIFAACDIFLMPSLWEGFGLVLLEAMAQNIPVIGSAVSAIPEVIVNGETGLLLPPRDVDGLAHAMIRLLDDPALRESMGQAGRTRLEMHFNPERMVDETEALYQRILTQKQTAIS